MVCVVAGPDFTLRGDNATVPDDTFAFFSNFGPSVKIAALGVNILSTFNGTGYAVGSAERVWQPHMSAEHAALCKAQHPFAIPSEVTRRDT